ISDVAKAVPLGFGAVGDHVLLLGHGHDELDGSEWAHVVHGHLGGKPPHLSLSAERELAEVLVAAAADGLLVSSHDLSEGGLAQALVECCLRGGVGARIEDLGELSPFAALFGESTARVLVSVSPSNADALGRLASAHGVPLTRLGEVGGDALVLEGLFEVGLAELRDAHTATLPAAMA
ncbi:MAG: AIR synthase-related protein, partial [Sporichthyaceae bacterium]